jgi:quercetin dioxygenase-like cupin family protein
MAQTSDELRIPITGLCKEGEGIHREMYFDELYRRLPKDPEVRVNVYTAEMLPGGVTDWHFHNGASLFLVLQGRVRIEFKDESFTYGPGDVIDEPIGAVHRAVNPEEDTIYACVGFAVTPPDRPFMVSVEGP